MRNDDDQRMKELTDRLVAMSPEPPPFPEEVTMTKPVRKTTMKPLTVFAAAAVVVLLGFGIPFLLMNGGEPPVAAPDTTTTLPDGSTSTEATTTTSDGSTASTEPSEPVAQFETIVFVYTESVDSYLGNPALVPFDTLVSAPAGADEITVIKETINLLGNPDTALPPGFESAVPAGVEALEVRAADGADNALIVEMNEAFLDGAGSGLLGDSTMLNQLIYTATIGGQYDEVQFIVNNQQVTEFGSEGLDLSSSVNRETFQEDLALIYVTSPILPNGDGNYVVEGSSSTFEAALTLRVLNADGNIVHEEPGTATCGSGCWGNFTFVLDPNLIEPGTSVQLLEYSAKDGSPQNVITVPISVGEPWNLLP
jgi:hypothetical protein